MPYLVGEVLSYLVGAFVLGGLVTWFFRGLLTARQIAANEELWIREAEQRRRNLAAAETQLATTAAEITTLRSELEAHKQLIARLSEGASQTKALEESVAEARGQISELRPLAHQLKERQRELRMAEREVDLLRARLQDMSEVVHEQQLALDAKNEHVVKLCQHIEALEPLNGELQLRNLTIAELQARLRRSEKERKRLETQHRSGRPSSSTTASADRSKQEHEDAPVRDDLKRIQGIGPKLERLLNRLGYERYEQIALWSDEDIAVIDAQLGSFRGRITRDHWVSQAQRLVDERVVEAKRIQSRSHPIALARRS